MDLNRRHFIQTAAAASSVFGTFRLIGADSPAKKHTTALIGSGWWGMNILSEAIASGACKVVALCDVDQRFLDAARDKVEKLCGDKPNVYKDYRELLEKEKPEIAIVATPDHWHPLITIAAVNAGAHVYVEKPISHTIQEGRAMVKAARRNDRVVQVGTHRRISPHNKSGMEFLKSGKAGKIGMVRAFVHYGGGPGRLVADEEAPAGLDWDLWLGPAPKRPYNRTIHPKGFRHYLDFANGQIGDWGIHWLDQILWWTDEKHPKRVFSTGGRAIRRDNTDAPDHQVAAFEFETFTAVWEHRMFAGNNAEKGENVGVYFYGTEGTFHMGWQKGWTFYPADGGKPVQHEDPQLNGPDSQNIRELWADFLQAIQTGRRPVCDIEIGHRSTTMSLLAMISLKIGKSLLWDGDKESIVGDSFANSLLRREYREPWVYPKA